MHQPEVFTRGRQGAGRPAKQRPRHVVAGLATALMLGGLAAPAAAQAPAPVAAPNAVKAGVEAWTAKDYATAVKMWRAPAAAGDPDAEFNLGQAYKLGRGVPQDLKHAEALFGQAAAKGHIEAADNYGLLLFQRGAHEEAMPYIQAASDRGDPRAQYLLGISLFNGDGTPKDWVRAYALESLAQQAGLPQAKPALAQMDNYIPLAQRQQAAAMTQDMAEQAETRHTQELAAADVNAGHVVAAPDAPPAMTQPAMTQPAPVAVAPPPPPVHHRKPAPAAPAPALADAGGDITPDAPPPPPAKPHPAPHPAAAPAHEAPAATQGAGGEWKLQLGAFGVAANADAQWNRVKGMAGVSGHARAMVPSGRVTRLLATGFSEDGARGACAKLTAAGIACLPTRN